MLFSKWSKSARAWSVIAVAMLLAGSATAVIAGSNAASGYLAGSQWSLSTKTALNGSSSGLVTTLTAGGDLELSTHVPFSETNSPTSAQFDPNISMTTDALRWSAGGDCFAAGTCVGSGTYPNLATITIGFSEPVRNPTLHLEGIGALADDNATKPANATAFKSTYTLDSAKSGGATLGAVSSGASDLVVTGQTISAASAYPGTSCASTDDPPLTATDPAGCGSVHVIGTVTQLVLDVGVVSTVVLGNGSNATSGDTVGFAVTFDQTYSAAPASYDRDADGADADAPRHVLGDLALGTGATVSNPGVLDSPTSPSAVASGAAIKAPATAAVPTWPLLTTAQLGSTYSVTVPISGASRDGEVCGYIDFAHAGTFAATEDRACATFAPGAKAVTLGWTVPADLTAGLTYARLRAAYDPAQAQQPTGPAASGEVEDYSLPIAATLTIDSALTPGTTGAFDLALDNAPVTPGSANPVAAGAALTVSESPAAGTGFGAADYRGAVTCVDGLGATVTAVNAMIGSVTVPASGAANGRAQNVTCTFTNSGVASLALTGGAVPSTVTAIGQSVSYRLPVTNTSPVAITSLAVTASVPVTCPVTQLPPRQTTVCTATTTADAATFATGSIAFTATAAGRDPAGALVTSTATTIAVAATAQSALTLVATAKPTAVTAVGQRVSYSFTVTNSGNLVVAGVRVTGAGVVTCADGTLAPGATTTCTASYTVAQADVDAGKVVDTVTASADAGATKVTSAPARVETPIVAASALGVAVSGRVKGTATIGDQVTWTAVVTNTGLTTVTDLSLVLPDGARATCPSTELAPTASVTCILTAQKVTAVETNVGQITASATATGHTVSGPVASKAAVVAIRVAAPLPFTSVSELGPTLGAGAGALISGFVLLLSAGPRGRRRRGRRTS